MDIWWEICMRKLCTHNGHSRQAMNKDKNSLKNKKNECCPIVDINNISRFSFKWKETYDILGLFLAIDYLL